ncbi:hypothetical protein, variant [Puccinia triticina 1-1 BBBD Race 1]|nr:hypothetical protein, variant [Puccinia triticina 1-1 BBBD Race 1]
MTEVESNVSKLARCVCPEDRRTSPPTPQIVFYQPGQATFSQETSGTDVVNKIREAYAFLVQHYVSGDELLLFGFSRGAFIARTLAQMVIEIGILNMAGMSDFYEVFAAYQLCVKGGTEGAASARNFLDHYRHSGQKELRPVTEGTLKCVGVWDTVGVFGLPDHFADKYRLLGFKDRKLSAQIKYAFHAIALCEARKDLQPTRWESEPSPQDCDHPGQVLKQVWFPCSHVEAGGRIEEYDDVTYMSLIWMVANMINYNLLAMNEEYLHGLLSVFWTRVQRGFGLYDPEGPRRYCLSSTARQFPTRWNATTKETIHRSVFSSQELIPGLEKVTKEGDPTLIEELLPFEMEIRNHLDFLMKEWAIHEGHRVGANEFDDWPGQDSWYREQWYKNFKETELGDKPRTHALFLDLLTESSWPVDTKHVKEEMISSRRGRGHTAVEDAALRIIGTPID